MNYQQIHNQIINRAKNQNRKRLKRSDLNYVYYESHHVIPEHFFIKRIRKGPPGWLPGDPEESNNKVLLTGREHYVIHQLLVKIYPHEQGVIFAAHKMTSKTKNQIGRSRNKLYEWIRIRHAEAMRKRPTTKETREKMSKTRKGRPAHNKGKPSPLKGRKKSESHLQNLKLAWTKRDRSTIFNLGNLTRGKPAYNRKKVKCIETGEIFDSAKQAALKYGGCVDACARGGQRTAGGYHWIYV